MDNALKAIRSDEETLTVGNYLALFGGRDLEGVASDRVNADGSKGEFFTKSTVFDSAYTDTGRLLVDWEHGQSYDGEPSRDDVLGYVDWETLRVDDTGAWVERVLNRRSAYVQYLDVLIEAGLIGNSSEAIPESVKVGDDGEIKTWALRRDTFTVTPMEPRMLTGNVLTAVKGLAGLDAAFLPLLPVKPEPSGEDAGASCKARVGMAKALQLLIEIERT